MNPEINLALNATEVDALCQQYLQNVYQDLTIAANGNKTIITQTGGEILLPSMAKLISMFPPTVQDVFVDLGSGLGKLPLYFFLRTDVKEARGIEILPTYYQYSLQAARRVEQELPEFFSGERALTFFLGDFFKFPLTDVTIVYIASTLFGPDILCPLAKLFDDTPSIHTIFTLRALPSLKRLPLHKVVNIQASWSQALCYVYRNPNLIA